MARVGTAALLGLLVAACSGSPEKPSADTPEPQAQGSVASDPTQPEPSGLLLSEVGVDEPFVELANPGSEPADLAEASLVADGRPIDLPDTSPLDPGERRLVPVDDGILDPTGGSVLLYGAGETLVDSLIWGAGQGGSVSLAVGDFASESVEPGTTIGRPPGAVQPLRSTDWVVYPEAEVSPGEPNPASYRVQVATDETFSDVVLEETWNFDSKDDVCGDLSGTITWTLHETRDGPRDEHETSHDVVTLSVRFDEVDGEWVDSGSSYVWNGSSQFDTNPGDDPKAGYCNELHKTTTTTGGGAFETSLASSIWVDVAAESDEVYVSSWVAGVLNGHKETGTLMSDGGPNRWCELVPSDYTQGGGSTLDSQAEWGQIPRCPNYSESVMGTIGKDGRTAVFECEETETYEPVEGATGTVTMSVTGQLTFAKGQ